MPIEEAKTSPFLAESRYVFLNYANPTAKQVKKKQELQIEGLNFKSI